jgi:adenylate cyclase class 2
MLEVEMKFPVTEFGPLEKALAGWGATAVRRTDVDHYFNAPDRDFAKTDEALRVRCIGDENFVTYKGPKLDPRTKTRTEIEVGVAAGEKAAEDFRRLLTHLGYRFVAAVRKRRAIYHLVRDGFELEACLDEVENVGRFAELEIQAPEKDLDRARGVLLGAAGDLHLTTSERRSYLEMLLERQQQS